MESAFAAWKVPSARVTYAPKGQHLIAQGSALGDSGAIKAAPCKGKIIILWWFNDAALTGRSFYCGSYTQGVALG